MSPILRSERGVALVFTLVLAVALISIVTAGLQSATSGLRISNRYRSGAQADLAAEAGLIHARKVIEEHGAIRFDTDVVAKWATLFGSGAQGVSGASGATYTVVAGADPADAAEFMLLTATGRMTDTAERTMRIRLRRGAAFAPGAVYLANPGATTRFQGNHFLIDGRNYDLDGTRNTTDGDVAGITAREPSVANGVRTALSTGQRDNVLGVGGTPSVTSSAGPTSDEIRNEIVPDLISRPGVVTNPSLTGNDQFGTVASPRITYFTGNVTINGTMDGAGILIVDGALKITGNATFAGLIIVRGATELTTITGNATVLGSVWTTDLAVTVSGSASVSYSTEALELADDMDLPPGSGGNLLPHRPVTVSWDEL